MWQASVWARDGRCRRRAWREDVVASAWVREGAGAGLGVSDVVASAWAREGCCGRPPGREGSRVRRLGASGGRAHRPGPVDVPSRPNRPGFRSARPHCRGGVSGSSDRSFSIVPGPGPGPGSPNVRPMATRPPGRPGWADCGQGPTGKGGLGRLGTLDTPEVRSPAIKVDSATGGSRIPAVPSELDDHRRPLAATGPAH
jgi:hypothetical protein